MYLLTLKVLKTVLLLALCSVHVRASPKRCAPIPASLTSKKTGQKAWDKCLEYQEQLVYPCERSKTLSRDWSRGNHCRHNAEELIVGGKKALKNEFPHMAILGFGEDPDIKWQCGGSLISEKFILSAGHCISNKNGVPLTYAHVGLLIRREVEDSSKRYRIKNIITHPQYKPPQKYNDITLLESEKPITLDEFTVPACLHIGDTVDDSKASATGWGLIEDKGSVFSDILLKVVLTKFRDDECAEEYADNRHMRFGFLENTQMCYGDRTQSKDTCSGDSGGPLQIKSKNMNCMYVVLGVTSFGSGCGSVGTPAIYTRVAPYLSWIESIVWP